MTPTHPDGNVRERYLSLRKFQSEDTQPYRDDLSSPIEKEAVAKKAGNFDLLAHSVASIPTPGHGARALTNMKGKGQGSRLEHANREQSVSTNLHPSAHMPAPESLQPPLGLDPQRVAREKLDKCTGQ